MYPSVVNVCKLHVCVLCLPAHECVCLRVCLCVFPRSYTHQLYKQTNEVAKDHMDYRKKKIQIVYGKYILYILDVIETA